MLVAEGTYTGDGGASKAISGLGFAPKIVVVGTDLGGVRGTSFTATYSNNTTFGATVTDGIASLDSDGFTVGLDYNGNLTVYYWYALAGGTVDVGEYTGDGTDNRNITTAMQPDFVQVSHDDGAVRTGMSWSSLTADTTMAHNLGGYVIPAVDYIQGVAATSFQVGTLLNVTNKKYGWYAFKTTNGSDASARYTGDDVNPRTFTVSLGAAIKVVLVINEASTVGGAARVSNHPAGQSVPYPNAVQAGTILNFSGATSYTTDGGTRVNNSGFGPYIRYALSSEIATPLVAVAALPPTGAGYGGGIIPNSPYALYKSIRAAQTVYNNLVLGP